MRDFFVFERSGYAIIVSKTICNFININHYMKKTLLVLLLLSRALSYAQNYQCIQSSVKPYFINDNGYLRGIRIDSTITVSDTTIYYPYHTPRGVYMLPGVYSDTLDAQGGSWVGKAITQVGDSLFLFDNINGNTITIRGNGTIGDNWIFYRDTSTHYYLATMTGMDTMTVSGVIDSVKKILITAWDTSGMAITDPADSFEIILSKNNGFISVFDLYTFPYHQPNAVYVEGLDYYLNQTVSTYYNPYSDYTLDYYTGLNKHTQIFRRTSFSNPTPQELNVWNVGDVYQYVYFSPYYFAHSVPDDIFIDTITAKIVGVNNTEFDYNSGVEMLNSGLYATTGHISYSFSDSTGVFVYDTTKVFNDTLMPEEIGQSNFYFYIPNDTTYCMQSPAYIKAYSNGLNYNIFYSAIAGTSAVNIHKMNLGLVHTGIVNSDDFLMIGDNSLVYYNRSGVICDSVEIPPASVANLSLSSNTVSLSPNPATSYIDVSSSEKIERVSILNLLGQCVYNGQFNTDKATIDINSLPNGMYIMNVNEGMMRKFVKQ